MQRRLSFVIVEIESMEIINYKKLRMDSAIKNINKDTSFFEQVKILYYILFKWILNKLYINYIYSKSFYATEVNVQSNDIEYKIEQEIIFKINENGVYINGNYIPYEYIIQFNTLPGLIYMKLFGVLENTDKKILIKPSNKVITINIILKKKCKNVGTTIKKNMYYHIKYNKIDENAITLFKGEKNC